MYRVQFYFVINKNKTTLFVERISMLTEDPERQITTFFPMERKHNWVKTYAQNMYMFVIYTFSWGLTWDCRRKKTNGRLEEEKAGIGMTMVKVLDILEWNGFMKPNNIHDEYMPIKKKETYMVGLRVTLKIEIWISKAHWSVQCDFAVVRNNGRQSCCNIRRDTRLTKTDTDLREAGIIWSAAVLVLVIVTIYMRTR